MRLRLFHSSFRVLLQLGECRRDLLFSRRLPARDFLLLHCTQPFGLFLIGKPRPPRLRHSIGQRLGVQPIYHVLMFVRNTHRVRAEAPVGGGLKDRLDIHIIIMKELCHCRFLSSLARGRRQIVDRAGNRIAGLGAASHLFAQPPYIIPRFCGQHTVIASAQ